MKNIYFYIYPEKRFAPDYVKMAKSQIDNSLLYWRPEDILIVTNFDWEYKGIKTHVVEGELNAKVVSHGTSNSNKALTASYLIRQGLVGQLNWFHDWDIYQLAPLEIGNLDRDMGLTEYSSQPRIQLGSIFFKPQALDIFDAMSDTINEYRVNEEEATNLMLAINHSNILDRIRLLDVSYSVGMRNLKTTLQVAEQPLKIAHFPPYKPNYLHKARQITPGSLDRILTNTFVNPTSLKNMLVYISPNKTFNPEHKLMLEVQIDNSLYYWNRDDIILLTNFAYEYNGVKAIEVPDSLINKSYATNARGIINSKVDAMIYAIEKGIVTAETWFHDFDAFQVAPLALPPIDKAIAVVCYGIYPQSRLQPLGRNYDRRINFGNVFFKPESLPILTKLLQKMAQENLYEEDAMTVLMAQDTDVAGNVQVLDQSYNIGMRWVRSNIAIAKKPVKVMHFPPHWPHVLNKFKPYLPSELRQMLVEKFESQ